MLYLVKADFPESEEWKNLETKDEKYFKSVADFWIEYQNDTLTINDTHVIKLEKKTSSQFIHSTGLNKDGKLRFEFISIIINYKIEFICDDSEYSVEVYKNDEMIYSSRDMREWNFYGVRYDVKTHGMEIELITRVSEPLEFFSRGFDDLKHLVLV